MIMVTMINDDKCNNEGEGRTSELTLFFVVRSACSCSRQVLCEELEPDFCVPWPFAAAHAEWNLPKGWGDASSNMCLFENEVILSRYNLYDISLLVGGLVAIF